MAVFWVEKILDYSVMVNHHLRNTALSLKPKELLCKFFCKNELTT